MKTVTITMTDEQARSLSLLDNPFVQAHGRGDDLLAYVVDEDSSVELHTIAPDGSYTYESLVDGMCNGWTTFDETGREVEVGPDGGRVLVEGGRVDKSRAEARAAAAEELVRRFGLDGARRVVGQGHPSYKLQVDIAPLRRPTEECRHCGHPIAPMGGRWTHTDADGLPLLFGRGCRSAAWTRDPNGAEDDHKWPLELKAAALPGVRMPKEG